MSKRTNMIGLRLTDDEFAAAQQAAQEESRTLASVARVALREYLADKQRAKTEEAAE